jgi:long-chain acyl-CoA synthetase
MAISALSAGRGGGPDPSALARTAGSVGRAQSQVEIAHRRRRGPPAAAGETGEIMVRGVPVMPGYWKNPKHGKTRDGWLMTGDVGRLDEDGYLTLKDRSKDVIISGGTNIYPREVEEVLLTHPDVHEVSVVGRPVRRMGRGCRRLRRGRTRATVDPPRWTRIASTRWRGSSGRRLYRGPELPKNNYGKVLKTELRRGWGNAS